MARVHLTDLAIRKLPHPPQGYVKYWDTKMPAFGVRVSTGSKSFVVMQGKARKLSTIGRYPEISLSDARKEAKRLLAHPEPKIRLDARLSDALTAYLSELETRARPNTIRSYRHFLSLLPDKPLDQITAADLPDHRSHAVMACRVFFNWCIAHGLTDSNPFKLQKVKYGQRSRVLTTDELRSLWAYDFPPFSNITKLLLLTGQRRNEVNQIEPSWITDDTITIPAKVAKNGQEHVIPFGPRTAEILTSNSLPFSFGGWSKGKARMDKHTGVGEWTLHDLRRTFATLHAEIGTPIHITEALLNHKSGTISGVAAIYIRHNWLREMREACLKYEEHVATLIAP